MLKKTFDLFKNDKDYVLHVVPFSSRAFTKFVECRAEIVLLDVDTMAPYETILEQLNQCQWDHRVVLLRNNVKDHPPADGLEVMDKKSLSKRELQKCFAKNSDKNEKITGERVTFDWYGKADFYSYPDLYFLLFAKYVGDGVPFVLNKQNIINKMSIFGKIEIFEMDDRNYFLLLRKSTIDSHHTLDELLVRLQSLLSLDYGMLYHDNVKWTSLYRGIAKMVELDDYFYFLKGKAMSVDELIEAITPVPVCSMLTLLKGISQQVITGDFSQLKMNLRNIYLFQLKETFDFPVQHFVSWYLEMTQHMLKFPVELEKEVLRQNYASAEVEFQHKIEALYSLTEYQKNAELPLLLVEALEILFNDFSLPISLSQIADRLGINKIYLSRIFKEHTGCTVHEYLECLRLQHGCFLLRHTQIKIREISLLIGYEDSGYFSRIFKKKMKISPSEYRLIKSNQRKGISCFESTMEIGERILSI
ncbi:helix-turn-helix transcriptional regulator [Vagococcus elongatus]|uniref:helix-turn-helix transcriptional regulator n=1 Tax=Vagococcus elongatus TaxID=180344 RepID=UPI000F87D9CB|nr:response regulator transcription factor [Vagococcus elongatus]